MPSPPSSRDTSSVDGRLNGGAEASEELARVQAEQAKGRGAATTSSVSRSVPRIKLLVTDVDGTLVTSENVLTEGARSAVERLRTAGIALSIVTDRPPRGLAELTGPLAIETPVFAFDGAMLVAPDLATILEQHTLPTAASSEVLDVLLRHGLDVWVYRGFDWFVRQANTPHVAEEQRSVQFAPTVVTDLSSVLDGAVKLVGISDDAASVEACESELRASIGEDAVVGRSQPHVVDVLAPGVHKAAAVQVLMTRGGLKSEEVATIGDMPADVLMFGVTGMSIAMGNARPDVHRCARWVTTKNDDDGFARAVDRFVLGGGKSKQAKLGLPSHVTACLFDLDGVLTQTAKTHAAAWKQAFDEYLKVRASRTGEPFVPFDAIRDYDLYVDGKPRIDGTRSFLNARGIQLPEGDAGDSGSAETIRGVANRKNEVLVHLLEHDHVSPYAGSVAYLRAVRDAGMKTAVVSSSKNCRLVLASAGITEEFDVYVDGIVAEQAHLAGKPAPDTYLAAARVLTVEPARAAVFEDALAGVSAGRAGHFGYVVGVDRVGQSAELIEHGADVVVDDLGALLEAS